MITIRTKPLKSIDPHVDYGAAEDLARILLKHIATQPKDATTIDGLCMLSADKARFEIFLNSQLKFHKILGRSSTYSMLEQIKKYYDNYIAKSIHWEKQFAEVIEATFRLLSQMKYSGSKNVKVVSESVVTFIKPPHIPLLMEKPLDVIAISINKGEFLEVKTNIERNRKRKFREKLIKMNSIATNLNSKGKENVRFSVATLTQSPLAEAHIAGILSRNGHKKCMIRIINSSNLSNWMTDCVA